MRFISLPNGSTTTHKITNLHGCGFFVSIHTAESKPEAAVHRQTAVRPRHWTKLQITHFARRHQNQVWLVQITCSASNESVSVQICKSSFMFLSCLSEYILFDCRTGLGLPLQDMQTYAFLLVNAHTCYLRCRLKCACIYMFTIAWTSGYKQLQRVPSSELCVTWAALWAFKPKPVGKKDTIAAGPFRATSQKGTFT